MATNGGSNGPGGGPRWPRSPEEIPAWLRARLGGFRPQASPWLIVAVLVALWGLSGIFIVDPQEQAAVLRFGAVTRVVGPGPNYHLPYPIEEARVERVTEVRRVEIGFRTLNTGSPTQYRPVPRESLMLTGDESIVDVQFIVQYVVSDLRNYLFKVRGVEDAVRTAAESAMREVVGRNNIDSVLTEQKAAIEAEARELLTGILNRYEAGLNIRNVKLQDVQPPEPVADAFKAVASAREEREQLINEAEGYRNDLLPRARGEAQAIVNRAEGYRAERVNAARGETERFRALLAEYDQARDVTRDRLWLEAVEDVLAGQEKVVLSGAAGRDLAPLLPLKPLTGASGRATQGGNASNQNR